MGVFKIIQKNIEKFVDSNKNLQLETDHQNLSDVFLRLMDRLNLSNPGAFVQSTTSAVVITKKDDTKYIITLQNYEPPIKLIWTKPLTVDNLPELLERIASEERKIGYISTGRLKGGNSIFQLAIA